MYSRSAAVYDALCRHKDYAAASQELRKLVHRVSPRAASLLDVCCGTGLHLWYLRDHFRVEGLDQSRDMIAIARRRCPDVPLHEGTLVDFKLEARFDVVTCLFGSIGYSLTVDNLGRAVRCMTEHLEPGGMLIVEPWLTPEHFVPDRLVSDSVDDPDVKVARMYVTRCEGRISVFDSDYIVGTSAGIEHFKEREELGLFTNEEYQAAFVAAGLEILDTTADLFGYGLYVCRADGLGTT